MKCEKCGLELAVVDGILDEEVVSVQCYCTDCKEMVFIAKLASELTDDDYEWLGEV